MKNSTSILASTLFVFGLVAGCSSDPADSFEGDSNSRKLGGDSPDKNASSNTTNGGSTTSKPKLPPLPDQKPVRVQSPVRTARQVLTAGPFTGEQPAMRANDRHDTPVTGKDCMTCHGKGGSAPHFALGGTIALGKEWIWGTPTWNTSETGGNAYGSYDGYGSYEAGDASSYGDLSDGYNTGGYDTGGYGDDDYGGAGCDGYGAGGYDTGGYGSANGGGGGGGGYGYDDNGYDTGGYGDDGAVYGQCRGGGKGWPTDRTTPSAYTGVRIVSSDGYIFDCVTDTDGNFWFKTPDEVKVPAYTGIRYGTFTVTGDTNGIACASCHESGKPDSPGRLWTWDGPTPRR